MSTDRERDYREEAALLAELPRAEREAILDAYRRVAVDPRAAQYERAEAAARARAVEQHLDQMTRRKRQGR